MLRKLYPLLLILTPGITSGCYTGAYTGQWDTYSLSARNLGQGTGYFFDSVGTTSHIKKEAEKAWRAIRKAHPDLQYSIDYARGFKDGFADYVEAGGTGMPPPYPPYCYRKSCQADEERILAVEDWFSGFRHGARIAQESGLRDMILVPLSSPPVPPPTDTTTLRIDADRRAVSPNSPTLPAPTPAPSR